MGRVVDCVVFSAIAFSLSHLCSSLPATKEDLLSSKGSSKKRFDIISKLPSISPGSFVHRRANGSYSFAVEGKDQWRAESRSAAGDVEGAYMYITPEGEIVHMEYTSGRLGYRAHRKRVPPIRRNEKDDIWGKKGKGTAYGALRLSGVPLVSPEGPGLRVTEDDALQAIAIDILPA